MVPGSGSIARVGAEGSNWRRNRANCWNPCSARRSAPRTRRAACRRTCRNRRRTDGSLSWPPAKAQARSPKWRNSIIWRASHRSGSTALPSPVTVTAGRPEGLPWSRPDIRFPTKPGLRAPNARSHLPTRRERTISCWCCCPAAPRRIGSRRRPASVLPTNRRRPGRCCAAAPISGRSTACANISPASKAAGSPSVLFRPASSRSRFPTCRATIRR